MVLRIKSEEAKDLARELARETGESLTIAVTEALRDRLTAVRQRRNKKVALDQIQQIARSRVVLDARSDDEIVGYGATGAPT